MELSFLYHSGESPKRVLVRALKRARAGAERAFLRARLFVYSTTERSSNARTGYFWTAKIWFLADLAKQYIKN